MAIAACIILCQGLYTSNAGIDSRSPWAIHTVSHCVWGSSVMGKYEPLGQFLRKQRAAAVPLTFREIEKITGVKLPPKAQHHRAWWSNNPSNNVMTKVWL